MINDTTNNTIKHHLNLISNNKTQFKKHTTNYIIITCKNTSKLKKLRIYLVLGNLLSNFLQVTLSKDQPNITLHPKKTLKKIKHKIIKYYASQIQKKNYKHTTKSCSSLRKLSFPVFSA